MRAPLLGIAMVLASGCKKDSAPDAAISVPVVAERPAIEVADASSSPMREVTPLDAEAVALYLTDCRAQLKSVVEGPDGEVTGDECVVRDFDQFCAPDTFKCLERRDACLGRCDSGCGVCQNACGKICVDCKTECAKKGPDAGNCLVECAGQRNECRHTCLAARSACNTAPAGCGAAMERCEEDGNRKRQKACPDCDKLNECLFNGGSGATGAQAKGCLAKFPGNAKECLEWCSEQ